MHWEEPGYRILETHDHLFSEDQTVLITELRAGGYWTSVFPDWREHLGRRIGAINTDPNRIFRRKICSKAS